MLGVIEERKVMEVSREAKGMEDLKREKDHYCQEMSGRAGCKWLQSGDCVISNKKCEKS
ncbi:hypothetical protein PM10SUCC1_23260 [Propionigenium maris DSM 9537]|uniref:Uncharacterized protein n=1 Tax=Propionigenium maris DSM 9537 TaxID=1123000 RepID=A0A9W6GM47_9FUSO|nr:hypothetical protein [Propionigenium maris]GLI56812.1 hypothetical protein PM10SUCC1_23260 [Propionigenium maris DSM 9537]